MLNGRAICLGVLCMLFIASTVLAQSQSTTETIIDRIYQSEGKVREHVDTKVEGIETKISAVDTKVETLSTTVGTLSTDVAVNKTNITNIQKDIDDLKGTVDLIWYNILGVLGTLIVGIVSYFVKSWREGRGKADSVDVVDRLTEQIAKLTSAQAEAQAKILERISAQTAISETRYVSRDPKVPGMEGLDELTDNRRSQQHDVRKTA